MSPDDDPQTTATTAATALNKPLKCIIDEVVAISESDVYELSLPLLSMSDSELRLEIDRLNTSIPKLSGNLPDKGEELKLELGRVEDEWRRRVEWNVTGITDRCKKPMERSQKLNSVSDRMKRAAQSLQSPESLEFARIPRKKLDNNSRKQQKRGRLPRKKLDHNSRNQQKRGRLSGNLASRPLSQEKLLDLSTFKNGSNGLGSKGANDDKDEPTAPLVDEEEPEVSEKIQEAQRRRSRRNEGKIFYPSRDDPQSLEILRSELSCLEPGVYLTSTIMNFYIRFLQQRSSTYDISKQKFHFFNSYFYSKLQEAVARQNDAHFIKFRRWWKGVNLFEKTYIFLPVNEDLHWSLVIICISDEEDLIILHLDSLGMHRSRSIFNNVKSLLENEWKYLKDGEAADVPIPDILKENISERIHVKVIEAPQQPNDCDCGLFALYYIERFIQDAPEKLREEHFSEFGKKWFKAQDASSLRGRIKNILLKEFKKAQPEDNSLYEPMCLPTIAKKAEVVDSDDSINLPLPDHNETSHYVHVPPGSNTLSDVLISTPIFTGDGEGGSGFAAAAAGDVPGYDFGVDPNRDPELAHALAHALRVSMEEERARQEAAAKRAADEASGQQIGESSSQHATMGESSRSGAEVDKKIDIMDDENALLQQTLAMSIDEPASTTTVRDINMSDAAVDDQDLQLALQLSVDDGEKDPSGQSSQTDMSKLLSDQSFVSSILASLPGVDLNDPSVKDLLASMQNQSEKKDEDKPSEEK